MNKSPKPSFTSWVSERILRHWSAPGETFDRKFKPGDHPELTLYYEPGDAHSHLCAQLVPLWEERLAIDIRIAILPTPDEAAYPVAESQRQFARDDAVRMAPAYGLQLREDAAIANQSMRDDAARLLLAAPDQHALLNLETAVSDCLFANDRGALDKLQNQHEPLATADAAKRLQKNRQEQTKRGHYLPGMWHFGGEWFWALDRVDFLEARLRKLGLMDGDAPLLQRDDSAARLPAVSVDAPLDYYFSFRSPYSYLSVTDVQRLIADTGVTVRVRPVLPMVMRGHPVPMAKKKYIPTDTLRLAKQQGKPFGKVHDPVGKGVERCLTVFTLCEGTDQQLQFLQAAGLAIWSMGLDLTKDAGLRHVCEQAGVDWNAASEKLAAGMDLAFAETNRQALFDAKLWGVPSFVIGDLATWGQDRLWMVEEALRRR